MSALGSSVINKSGKKFAPKKAPARRPAAPEATQVSAKSSLERQAESQTPQPQPALQPNVASPSPSVHLNTLAPTERASSHNGDALRIPAPSRSTPVPTRPSPSSVIPQKRSLPPPQVSTASTSIRLSPQDLIQEGIQASNLAAARANSRQTTSPPPTNQLSNTPSIASASGFRKRSMGSQAECAVPSNGGNAPATRKRRIDGVEKGKASAQQPAAGPNDPLPSTETSEITVQASTNHEVPRRPVATSKGKTPRKTQAEKRRLRIEESAAAIVEAAAQGSTIKAKKPRRTSRKRTAQDFEKAPGQSNPGENQELQGQEGQTEVGPVSKKRKTSRKSKKQSLEHTAAAVVDDAVQATSKDPQRRKRKPKRAVTPEGAEMVVIAPSETKMADLCKDGGTGRKSAREAELREMERAEMFKKKQKQLQENLGEAESPNQAGSAGPDEARHARDERQSEREQDVAHHVPNIVVVNGQITLDETSLQIDRHAVAAIEREAEQLEGVDENDLTRKINSASWLKRDRSGGWNEILLDRFYSGLRMFGTDFEMIAAMFPGKTRHAIKLKFCKEEKYNYPRIKAALMGERLPVVLEEYQKMTGTEYDDPKELEKDIEEDRKKLEEEQQAEKEAMEAAVRERAEQAERERAEAGEDSGKGSGRRKKKKGSKKGKRKESTPRTKARKPGMLDGEGERQPQPRASEAA